MYASTAVVDEILRTALDVVGMGDDALHAALDELPAAIYVTDTEGLVTYFNPACVDFAGRTPAVGQDRWCVTWKLYTDEGEFLPHDECPMAVAIKTKFAIRGVTAVAERPDGTRVNFRPYPTPVISEDGELLGAVDRRHRQPPGRVPPVAGPQVPAPRRVHHRRPDRRDAESDGGRIRRESPPARLEQPAARRSKRKTLSL